MPNSRVRSLIENASTPPTPIAAIVSASTAKPPNSVAFSRDGATRSAADAVSQAIVGHRTLRIAIVDQARRFTAGGRGSRRPSGSAAPRPGEFCVAAS